MFCTYLGKFTDKKSKNLNCDGGCLILSGADMVVDICSHDDLSDHSNVGHNDFCMKWYYDSWSYDLHHYA